MVLSGSFNPRIFDPWWFAKEGLIQDDEAKNAEITVMTSNVAVFSLGWMRLHAESERLQINTSQPQYFDTLRDFVLGTFRILRHVPLTAIGLHWMAHFRSENEEEWRRVGNVLAPKAIWNEVLIKPGLLNLTIQETRALGEWSNVVVEPSLQIRPGIYFEVHEHIEPPSESPGSAGQIVKMFEERWTSSRARAAKIREHILTKTLHESRDH